MLLAHTCRSRVVGSLRRSSMSNHWRVTLLQVRKPRWMS